MKNGESCRAALDAGYRPVDFKEHVRAAEALGAKPDADEESSHIRKERLLRENKLRLRFIQNKPGWHYRSRQ